MATKRLEYFALYSEKCLTCKHLVEIGKVDNRDCHYSKGNTECPASEVRLVIVGEALSYAQQVIEARDKRHAKKEARLMKYVGAQSQAFKSQFYDFLDRGGKSK